jgi:hypothetical protein
MSSRSRERRSALTDESRWICEVGGQPLDVVADLLEWLDRLPGSLDDGEAIMTRASWQRFRQQALAGETQHVAVHLANLSTTVRYPADGMAFVIAPRLHPDQDEAIQFPADTEIFATCVTLLHEEGAWKIQKIGLPVSPADVGKEAYSW